MSTVAHTVSAVLYVAVGAVSAIMAGKCCLSKRYLPFHEEAAGRPWEELDPGVRSVILALLRVSGLGFLVVASLLLSLPVAIYCTRSLYLTLVIPCVSLLFCLGLFFVNFRLSARTGARTPWKGALLAALWLLVGMGLSFSNW